MQFNFDWAYQQGTNPQGQANFKQQPADFQVTEVLGFEPVPEEKGQHHWLWIRKEGANTEYVARQLAAHAGIAAKLVSYSGLKDRQAVTHQWFSVELNATQTVDWSTFAEPGVSIERHLRSVRKLRRGTHQANDFVIMLRDVTEPQDIEQRLQYIAQHGVPNYYGEQRFGHQGRNLEKAQAMFGGKRFKDRNLRSLVLSSARSYLFNQVVSARVSQQLHKQLLLGDVCMLRGSHSFFCWQDEQTRAETEARLVANDIQLTAPLWGRGEAISQLDAREFETRALQSFDDIKSGLERAGLKQERRVLQLKPEQFSWQWQGAQLTLSFRLPTGTFATSVLRELVRVTAPVASLG